MSRETPQRSLGSCPQRILPCVRRSLIAGLAACFLALPATAETRTGYMVDGVVELFTSQGCANCPQADEVLSALAEDSRVLALSYHVDYWDYIGWKDPLGSVRNTERQRAYARAWGDRSVYTPQMILNGRNDVRARDRAAVETALRDEPLAKSQEAARVTLTKDGSTVRITADAAAPADESSQIVLVLVTYQRSATTRVERGENDGRVLVNSHSVRDWQVVGKMNGGAIAVDMPAASLAGAEGSETGCAAMLQVMEEDGSPGPILAAAVLPF